MNNLLDSLLDFKAGYKTYAIGVLNIIFGISGYLTEKISLEVAIPSVMIGLGLITGRRAVKRIQ